MQTSLNGKSIARRESNSEIDDTFSGNGIQLAQPLQGEITLEGYN